MSTELSMTVITEQHITISDILVSRVKNILDSNPELTRYSVGTHWDNVEEAEFKKDNLTVQIRMVRAR